jgi:hypothetical protein
VRPNFQLWNELYHLDPYALTRSAILDLQAAILPEKRFAARAVLLFLHESGVAKEERLDIQAKTELIKAGEQLVLSADREKILDEVEAILQKLSNPSNKPDELKYESLRAAALLLHAPFDTTVMETMIDTVILLSRLKDLPADASFILLWAIYEKALMPIYKRFFLAAEPDFWETYCTLALKVMSRYLHDAAMQYILYYEEPPGSQRAISYLERCGKLLDVALEVCYLIHQLSPFITTEIDRNIYSFCTEVITKANPQPLITYSYRLLDLSSEDFFVTLPKEQINNLILKSISKLPKELRLQV